MLTLNETIYLIAFVVVMVPTIIAICISEKQRAIQDAADYAAREKERKAFREIQKADKF